MLILYVRIESVENIVMGQSDSLWRRSRIVAFAFMVFCGFAFVSKPRANLKSSSILHEYIIQYKSIFHEWKQKQDQNSTTKRIFCDVFSVRVVCVQGWNKAVLFSSVLLLSQAIDKDRSFSFPLIFKENKPKGVPCFCEVSSLFIKVNRCPRFLVFCWQF